MQGIATSACFTLSDFGYRLCSVYELEEASCKVSGPLPGLQTILHLFYTYFTAILHYFTPLTARVLHQ
jgi:hypothetical protein